MADATKAPAGHYTKTIVACVSATVITIACAITGQGISESEWVYVIAAWTGAGGVFTFPNKPYHKPDHGPVRDDDDKRPDWYTGKTTDEPMARPAPEPAASEPQPTPAKKAAKKANKPAKKAVK